MPVYCFVVGEYYVSVGAWWLVIRRPIFVCKVPDDIEIGNHVMSATFTGIDYIKYNMTSVSVVQWLRGWFQNYAMLPHT